MEDADLKLKILKQEALRKIIWEFSEKFIEDLTEYIELVELIYNDEFRHSYSDITAILIKLNKENPQALEQISYNFSSLVDEFPKEDFPDAYKSLNKLYDHIVLEQIRLKEVYGESKEIAEHAKDLSDKATISLEKADELVEETTAVKTEVITVLGIFAAILLAFVGGLTFSTSVLANLHQVSVYRIIIAILLIGLVLINILYGLFYYVDRLVRRHDEQKMKPLIIANVIIIVMIAITVFAWNFAWVEKRNEKVDKLFTRYEVEENISIEE